MSGRLLLLLLLLLAGGSGGRLAARCFFRRCLAVGLGPGFFSGTPRAPRRSVEPRFGWLVRMKGFRLLEGVPDDGVVAVRKGVAAVVTVESWG